MARYNFIPSGFTGTNDNAIQQTVGANTLYQSIHRFIAGNLKGLVWKRMEFTKRYFHLFNLHVLSIVVFLYSFTHICLLPAPWIH